MGCDDLPVPAFGLSGGGPSVYVLFQCGLADAAAAGVAGESGDVGVANCIGGVGLSGKEKVRRGAKRGEGDGHVLWTTIIGTNNK